MQQELDPRAQLCILDFQPVASVTQLERLLAFALARASGVDAVALPWFGESGPARHPPAVHFTFTAEQLQYVMMRSKHDEVAWRYNSESRTVCDPASESGCEFISQGSGTGEASLRCAPQSGPTQRAFAQLSLTQAQLDSGVRGGGLSFSPPLPTTSSGKAGEMR